MRNRLRRRKRESGAQTVGCIIRKWRIEDKTEPAFNMSNMNILNNLRDGLSYPYTEKNAEGHITSMLYTDKSKTFAFAKVQCHKE